jgi:phosphoserine phosphatase
MFIATLIADGNLDDAFLSEIVHQFDIDCTAGRLTGSSWIDEGYAADMVFNPAPGFGRSDCADLASAIRDRALATAKGGFGRDLALDVIVQPAEHRQKKLLVADMDSTMITVECLDELADYAGIKAEIAAVTERAMRGELDFAQALDERVARLKGLAASTIDQCLAERVTLSPGAETLVRTMKAHGAATILVSGGFTHFADRVGAAIGFDRVLSNVLEIDGETLTGTVTKPIVDAATKERTLVQTAAALGISLEETMAVGDGANDLPMIRKAGLGVAYCAKPAVAAEAAARIEHADLTAMLYAQGIPKRDWVQG